MLTRKIRLLRYTGFFFFVNPIIILVGAATVAIPAGLLVKNSTTKWFNSNTAYCIHGFHK
jgi:hypothetical protein